ncbi:MAG: DUF2125 domain-containing protein [Paracoccaceae bacterium]
MRALTIFIIAIFLLWGGYWFVASSAVEKGLTNWLDDRANGRWQVQYASLNTRGFPNRFDTTVTDPSLSNRRAGIVWSAPFWQVFALSYKPNQIIAVWPNQQSVALPDQQIDVTSQNIRASVTFEPGTALTLNRSSFVLEDLALLSTQGWRMQIKSGRLATRQTVGRENTHDIFFQATQLQPPAALLSQLDPAGRLSSIIDVAEIDGTLVFDAPWDRFSLERETPLITAIELKKMRITWGDMDLQASGSIDVDRAGELAGNIDVTATNWRRMLALATANGGVKPGITQTIANALELLAQLGGDGEVLSAPLSFQDGLVKFGPIPLGRAPRLARR